MRHPIPLTAVHSGSAAQPQRPTTVRIMTYNVMCTPASINRTDPRGRIRAIARRIVLGDLAEVVCLQEVFDSACKRIARNELAAAFPYTVTNAGRHRVPILGQDSGLFVASKFPIESAAFLGYGNHIGSDWLADKGCLVAKVKLSDQVSVLVANTHGQAAPDPYILWWFMRDARRRVAAIRRENYARAAAFVRQASAGCQRAIFCGDFNIAAEDESAGRQTEESKWLHETLGSPHDAFRLCHPDARAVPGFTYDSTKNRMVTEVGTHERLDYVFVFKTRAEDITSAEVCEVSMLSDHYAVTAEIAGVQE